LARDNQRVCTVAPAISAVGPRSGGRLDAGSSRHGLRGNEGVRRARRLGVLQVFWANEPVRHLVRPPKPVPLAARGSKI